MNFLILNRLTSEKLNAVVELDRLCFGGLWTLEGYQREINSSHSDLFGLFLPSSLLVGFGCLWSIVDEAHITILAVHPQHQRQGLGQAILVALLWSANHRGLERASLEVRASNKSAIALYQKFGFKTAGRRRKYYQDTGEDALILWRGDLQEPEFIETLATWQQEASDRIFRSTGYQLQLGLPEWDIGQEAGGEIINSYPCNK